MEAVSEFLNQLASKGVKLSAEAGQLNCYAPKGALTDDLKTGILEHKAEILALFEERGKRSQGAPSAPKEFPLSAGQMGLYILQKLHPGMSAYNVPLCFKIDGALNIEMMAQAWDHVLKQFPILTARVIEKNGTLVQCLDEACKTTIEQRQVEFTDDQELLAFAQDQAKIPFDLNRGPLTRIQLFRQGPEKSILLITVNHIVFDGSSAVILLGSLLTFYAQLCDGKPVRLAPLAGYEAFVAWEEAMLASPEGASHAAYWQKQLSGELPVFSLLPELPHAASPTFEGRTLVEDLPEDLARAVQDFAKSHALPPSVMFLAVFQLLLHKYSSQDEIIVGMPVMGRAAQKFAGDLGYFINMVPLRTRIGERLTLKDYLRNVQGTMLDALYHSSYPFPLIVDQLASRQNRKDPVFQVSYAYQNFVMMPTAPVQHQAVRVETLQSIAQEGEFDLGMEIYETPKSFSVHLKFNPDLYSQKTILRLFAHFRELLRAITADPNRFVHEYSVVTDAERRQLLVEFNDTRADYPRGKCLHDLFVEQVGSHSGDIAVICGEQRITYEQLFTKSRDLALDLQSKGVGPDQLVGLCMERSLDMLVGMLGILQAGGAYVPLDPEHPPERLAYMVKDSRASIVLTQESLREKLSALISEETQLVALDREWPEISDRVAALQTNGVALQQQVRPEHLAYVIYTSGSTGQPKGVAIEHHSPVTLVQWASEVYSREELAGVLAGTSICFDLSVYEIFVTLANGGTIILVPNALALAGLAHADAVTLINTVPSAMEELVRQNAIPPSVQTINLAGEPLAPALVDKIYEIDTVQKVYDLYGPSEDTTYSTYVLRKKNGPQTIGRPVANTQVYILDAHRNLQPIGIPGELYIAGDGLCRGYLYRPELTQEKFVDNPFEPGSRMYKTGDLARWFDDGTLQYLGRIDTQVKVRGFRIEIGEIEARLKQHPGILDNAVVAQGQGASRQLIAFYRAKETTQETTQETTNDQIAQLPYDDLRAHLLKTLPDYMVPSAFVSLAAIPLNPNGKVDRRALTQMDVTLAASREYVAPRNETERLLVDIWAVVLGLAPEKIGVHDNFFELGGHSLLATQLISKIRSQLNADLPLKAIFDGGGVAELAQLITNAERNGIPPIQPVDRTQFDRLPLSFAQERLWFFNELEPGNAGYNVPGAVTITGELEIGQLEQAFNLIIARHENLRTLFPSQDGRAQQRILDRVDFKLERIDLSSIESRDARDREARRICQADAATPFDLANGPLLRGKVIKLAEDEHVLMLNMHHIISDGWSVGVLVKELGVLMDALRQGRNPELPPLPIQYADYSVWQRRWLDESGVLEQQLAYWREKLAGVPESLELATDHPRPGVQSFAGATHAFALDAQLSRQLKRLAEQQGGTLYMVLLAAFKALLHRYTGQSDICVGSPIANRQYGETEGLIGMFVNTLAMRSQVEGTDSFNALLSKVKATCLEAYEHQDAPFEKIVDMLRPQRNMAITPLVQVMMILQNVDMGAPDARLQRFPVDSGISKFDLTLELTETVDGLAGSIEYSTALYKPQTIARFSSHFASLCRAIVAAPATEIRDLDYLGDTEKHRLLVDFNDTQLEVPKDRCLHELFVEQVALHPDATAVVCGGNELTYQQLYARSRDLALYLQTLGIAPDSLVCLCMERSLDMVVALVGVVQAGGAYVPLDPEYPDERLAFMLRDSGAAIVLTERKFASRVAALVAPNTKVIALDKDWPKVRDCVAELKSKNVRLRRDVRPHHLAYVIYTSGSTGEPKGVMVEHRNLANLVEWHRTAFDLNEGDVSTAIAGVGFDAAVWEIWPSLCVGASLASPAADVLRNPEALLEWWSALRVDVSFLPTPLAEFAFSRRISNPHLRALLVGGDRLDQLPLQPEPFLLINNYGPTECTVVSTSGVLESTAEVLHIGRPISNTQIYILDAHQKPVPVGVAGEIYVGGASVARGYLNRPQLTSERFVLDPFSSEVGARMYRTGDLARWLDDGNIQYLGRIDTQVKIRGFRIETGEIEARLRQHPEVQDSAVIVQGQGAGKQLVAFYRAKGTAEQIVEVSNEELRAHLSRTLPEYMVPVAFVSLAAIPLNPNGKVDRRALAQMDVTVTTGCEYVAPRNETEQQLVEIWSQVLDLAPEKIGINDNFFELGGHSLLATQLISKIRARFEVDLPLKALFEEGTVAQLGQLLAAAEKSDVPAIVPVNRSQFDRLPLSFAQERLWFLNELEPENAGYNVPGAVTITGALDIRQLEEAFNLVIARHENLRTVFPSEGGQAQQKILDRVELKIERIDLSYEARDVAEQQAKRICQADAATTFDLAHGPLLRGKVIKLADDEHVLMLNMHHIISDGWSVGVLIRELGAIMGALREGRTPQLAPLPIQYADYSVWQRRWLDEGGVLDRQLAYWQKKLAGAPESLDLATDYPRPSVATFAGATHTFALDAELSAQLKRIAEQQGGTLYMVLLAAFNALLHRYTGQDDLCVGTPIANRQYGETEGLIGMFVNTLALRTQVDATDSFASLLAKVKTTCLEAYEHQDAPFEKVIDSLKLQRNLAISPLFQIMVILQNTEKGAIDPSIRLYPLDAGISKFDLTVEFSETADGLAGAMRYRTALYKPETIARMATHFTALCEAIAAAPTAAIGALDYLSAAEEQTLLVEFNESDAEYPKNVCVPRMFAEQAALHPDEAAVVFGDEQLTYRELAQKSRALASYLRAQGVKADSLVGLCAERSLDMIVGLMGILEAGGAYVPLDPDLPAERLQYMLDDAAPAIVLTQSHLKATLPSTSAPVIALDSDWSAIDAQPQTNEPIDVRPEDLAYVIYTSGSTGAPKGVMIEHGSLTNYLTWITSYLESEGIECLPAVTNLSFDASLKQIFGPLITGKTVRLVGSVSSDPEGVLRIVEQQRGSAVNCVPSLWRMLIEMIEKRPEAARKNLRGLLLGGEEIPRDLIRRSLELNPDLRITNLYGPTETTANATFARGISLDDVSIGRPVANTQIYILDRQHQPVPIGVLGEIYIGGIGVARGYLNREELTAERFIADPFSTDPNARLYRSGDVGRWRADGNIEYFGRNDQQVKLRGYRIELGEIEAQLVKHASVKEAVVLAREDEPGEKRLVAYVTGDALDVEALRTHMQASVPAYMVPSAFVVLEALPLTPSRKLDRKALPKPEAHDYANKEYEAPQGEIEETLAAIWQDLLHVERVGRYDNFFELGGHSLLATQLISKIRARLDVDLPLKALFSDSTVAQLALLIAKAEKNDIPPIVPVDRTQFDRLPLSFAQERLWFLNELEPNSAGYNVPGAVTITGALDVHQLEEAFNLVIARHENLRTVFPSQDGQAQQRILDRVELRLERIDLSDESREIAEQKAKRICQADAAASFDLAHGPLLRGKVIKLADDEHVLMLNMHHIISDGWSVGVLIRELGAIMGALREGRTPQLSPLPIQYADYSVWQRRWLDEGGVLDRQLAYWQKKLAGTPESLDLATDYPRPSVQTFAGATHTFALDAELSGQFKRIAEHHGGTLYMVLLAAFNALLHRYTGQDDLCVGTPIANRQYGETEGLIGMFVNTLALRTQVDATDSFASLLAKVKTTCLEAYEHQDAPFEKVIDSLKLQRNLAISPLFQIMVILQNTEKGAIDPSIRLYPLDAGISKFDLTVEFSETADGLAGAMRYRTALYKPETIARMAAHFTALCQAIVAAPSTSISALDYLSAAEEQTLLVEFNESDAEYPKNVCVPRMFAEQAALHPDEAAVVFGDEQLTYRELARKSRALAAYLRAQGVKADSLVGLCAERSLDMIVGLMGILEAGGAYVPLDPDLPAERLQYMLDDAAPAIVLTQSHLKATLPPTSAPVIALDSDWSAIEAQPQTNEPIDVRPEDLAYVIYTSGSTGAPKGVMIEHGSLTNYLTWIASYLESEGIECLPAVTNLSFDASLKQIFGPLITGKTVRLVGSVSSDPEGVLRIVEQQRGSAVNCVPSLWRMLIELIEKRPEAARKNLRGLLLGGEEIPRDLIRRSLEINPELRITNLYGPTETTANATFARGISLDDVSIGRPVANTRIYILDRQHQPVPIGVLGEIYIGGVGVARGYLNRPELTAERFLADPFSADPNARLDARLYRSGDVGRWRADGNIEYFGRNDQQVKLRGYRIELGEIEAQLVKHPGVKEAVVLAREDEPTEKRLVAYVTGDALDVEALRTHMQGSVPAYMVPSAFVVLEALPLTPSRKLDRKALPKPEAHDYANKEYEAPQGEIEETLAAIWQDLLHVERVGRHDNFFELGGHSLLATQLISKIRARLDVDLPLKALFSDSTVAQLAVLIAKAEKNDIPPIVPVDRTQFDRLPLSFAQERLWFLNELEPNSAGYNVPGAVTITGALDVHQLEEAFNLVIARHENLRTVFPSQDGQAQQRILDRVELRLERIDLSHESRDVAEREAKRICQADAATTFDLAHGPLLRGKVIKLADDEHVLMLNMHHIISDGWSVGVLIRELGAIMGALREGRTPQLSPLPIQYADYSVWQRRWLDEGGVLDRQLAYWQKKLAGAPESLDLATDYPRPSVPTFAGATHSFAFDAELSQQLKRIAEQQGGTLYMVLLAAFNVLLHRYTGQNDLCLGAPIANRQYGETEGLIGMFVNTLALRTQVDATDSFASLFSKVKVTCLEAYEHQDAPFEKIVDVLHLQRNLAINPLFEVMVILQNNERGAIDASIQPYPLDSGISKFELTVEFSESVDGLAGSIRYRKALYKPETIARMAEHFTALCRSIVATPAAEIGALSFLDDAETRRLLVDFNDTRADYPKDSLLHQLFIARVADHAEETAVVCGDEELTYRQLYARSHDLALYLQSLGVQPDSLVGLCMERSLDMLVGMLGILQAGGAYVPLDPHYPDERLAYMLQDSRATIVLTQQSLQEKLRALIPGESQLIALDRQWPEIVDRVHALTTGGVSLQQDVRSDHLAYVIYTSGSTGQPKGVAIEHHSAATLVHWARDVYSNEELSGVLAATSICFDLSIYEIFLTLASGGTILLVPNALGLVDLAHPERVTLINTVPSAIEELLRLEAIPASVRTINLAGEPLPARLVDKLYDTTAVEKVFDLYGPSEDTTYSTYVLRKKHGPQTIGRPIANTQVFILNAQQRLQPIGVPGELHIAGDGLARGYLYRPELTQEKFVANPFEPGTRMYKTGDLARWLDNGTLQFLGRIDTQVKVRGFRIEMGEIEARLNQHPRIEDGVVIAQGQGADRQLIAFYRAKDTTADSIIQLPTEELRSHLLQTLPDYMVPSVFVGLEAIPLNPNGKIDRRALMRMDVAAAASQEYLAPRNDVEKQLVAIWAEVLRREPETIGVKDNFFELGGHSLSGVQLMAKTNRHFHQNLPLAILFTAPSIAALARVIADQHAPSSSGIVIPIQPNGDAPPVFAVPGAGGNVLSLRPLSKALGEQRPLYALQSVGLDGNSEPFSTIEQTARANVEALKTVQPIGPYSLIGHSYGGVVAYEMAKQLIERGEDVASLVLLDSIAPSVMQRGLARDEVAEFHEACIAVANQYDAVLELDLERMRKQSDDENVQYIVDVLSERGLEVSAEQFIAFYRVYQANLRCYRAYEPSKLAQKVDVSLYRASEARRSGAEMPRDYGWDALLQDPIRTFDVEANHFSILENVDIQGVGALAGSV